MNRRTAALILCFLLTLLAGPAFAQEPRIVLLENSDADARLHYPVLIAKKRGYRIRCQSQADEERVIRGLGFLAVPAEVLTAVHQDIIDTAPLDNPLLCPNSDSYKIQAFAFPDESGRRQLYLQFPTGFDSTTFTNKVYRPGCAELINALGVDLQKAQPHDPRPFFVNNIHDIECLSGTPPPSTPETFAAWCTKTDLTPAQEATVRALLDQTPHGVASLGDRVACTNAEAFLTTVTSLNLAGSGLTTLEPMSVLTKLTSLVLSDNQITDTAPLEKLTKLTFLDLARNKISNISALALMVELSEVDISSNQIASLRPLSSNRAITRLALANNQIADVSPLRFLQALTVLDLSNNQLSGNALAPLIGLGALKRLDLTNNRIETMEMVAKFASNTEVVIAGNPVFDSETLGFVDLCLLRRNEPTPLGLTIREMLKEAGSEKCDETMTALSSGPFLSLSGKQISDLRPIARLKNLTSLNLSNNSIIDVSPLATMTGLASLDLRANNIKDADILIPLPNLTRLDLDNNPVDRSRFFGACLVRAGLNGPQQAEIAALLKFAGTDDCLRATRILQHATSGVALEKLQLESLDYFPVLQNVRRLDLRKNALINAEPLRMLPHLMSLNVSGNNFTSIASLLPLTELEILDISGNPISSPAGIQALKKLRSLNLHRTRITQIGFLGSLPQLQIGKVMLGGLGIDYGSFESYCLVHKFDPAVLKEMGPFMAAIQPLLAAEGVDAANCEAVTDWARHREVLNLNVSNLASIEPVRFFARLRELRLSGNRIRDVSPLFFLSDVEILDLSQNRIEDVRPLTGLTKLRQLDLRANRLSTLESVNDILQYNPSLAGNPLCQNVPGQPSLDTCDLVAKEVILINVQTGKCLTIAGGSSTENNVPALQFDCDSHPSRRWRLVRMGDIFQTINVQTGKCLTIAGGSSTENNVPALQFDCDSHASRRWRLVRRGDVFQMQNVQTGKCLTIAGGSSTENNVTALQFDCDSHASRTWNIKSVTNR